MTRGVQGRGGAGRGRQDLPVLSKLVRSSPLRRRQPRRSCSRRSSVAVTLVRRPAASGATVAAAPTQTRELPASGAARPHQMTAGRTFRGAAGDP